VVLLRDMEDPGMTRTNKHLIIMPAYNPGAILVETVRRVTEIWDHVWVVVDGSNDGSESLLHGFEDEVPGFRLIVRKNNHGKGAAVLFGAEQAMREGFTHALVMDCDGQHPCDSIKQIMDVSRETPKAMILGQPVFGPDVPKERLLGRQISVGLAWLEVMGPWIGDPLFGFRVYPLQALLEVLAKPGRGRRYDFDHEVVVRLYWAGTPVRKIPAPCRYPDPVNGGVTHYDYVRDNLRLAWLHFRLLPGWFLRLPRLLRNTDSGLDPAMRDHSD